MAVFLAFTAFMRSLKNTKGATARPFHTRRGYGSYGLFISSMESSKS